MRTFKIPSTDRPELDTICLICPNCETPAEVPIYIKPESLPIASLGLGVVFDNPAYDPPKDWLPKELQCRNCKTIYFEEED